ncbi:hypothetical protein BD289DRAFT_427803 [Coniella lustricola]|uniref:Aminoglycoside phosphotransferase domain-containing protein n=1 Tax=Coniella lustricola TaxID=2025994 RepID=A0A2T3AES5_9PEZI|nr:hypothetical protein BD289DRAFT_427803 [Coniella lustricola]
MSISKKPHSCVLSLSFNSSTSQRLSTDRRAMAQEPFIPGQGDGIKAFFQRCGVPPTPTQDRFLALAATLFPGGSIQEATPQGYCSYTLIISSSSSKVLQFRPPAHKLDIDIARHACEVYGTLAPDTRLLTVLEVYDASTASMESNGAFDGDSAVSSADKGFVLGDVKADTVCFDVVSMARIPGISLHDYNNSHRSPETGASQLTAQLVMQQRKEIIKDFAHFIEKGWRHRQILKSSVEDAAIGYRRGKIGTSIQWRLKQMSIRLPQRFRPLALTILHRLDQVMELPWVLTHGDLVPSNIMVQQPRRHHRHSSSTEAVITMTGLLDWAEAEWLPFGVSLYGLDELLGKVDDSSGQFAYYPQARELYDYFWTCLGQVMLEYDVSQGSEFRSVLDASHAIGFLLWHGIAFDNGKLNRVVDEVEDGQEVGRLDLFLDSGFVNLVAPSKVDDTGAAVVKRCKPHQRRQKTAVTA